MSKPSISKDKDTSQEGIAEVADLLREAGRERREFGRELVRRMTAPLPDLLREGSA